MDTVERSFWDSVGSFCEEIQTKIDESALDDWRKEKAKSWLDECVEKGRQAREQDGDGLAVMKHEATGLQKHIDFFGKSAAA